MPGGLGAFSLLVAAGAVLAILLLVWLLSRDKGVARTSFGFYVERRRFDEKKHSWPVPPTRVEEDLTEKPTGQSQWPGA